MRDRASGIHPDVLEHSSDASGTDVDEEEHRFSHPFGWVLFFPLSASIFRFRGRVLFLRKQDSQNQEIHLKVLTEKGCHVIIYKSDGQDWNQLTAEDAGSFCFSAEFSLIQR